MLKHAHTEHTYEGTHTHSMRMRQTQIRRNLHTEVYTRHRYTSEPPPLHSQSQKHRNTHTRVHDNTDAHTHRHEHIHLLTHNTHNTYMCRYTDSLTSFTYSCTPSVSVLVCFLPRSLLLPRLLKVGLATDVSSLALRTMAMCGCGILNARKRRKHSTSTLR